MLPEDLALFSKSFFIVCVFLASRLQKFHHYVFFFTCCFPEKLGFLSLIENENSEINSSW